MSFGLWRNTSITHCRSFFPNGQNGNMNTYGHLTTASTVKDVIEHEAFTGFGQFILPAERRYDDNMPLANVASLLPYHNYVTGERAVETINTMIDYVQDGNRLFYDIYSDEDKRTDARKNNTGLFFLSWKAGQTVRHRLSRRWFFLCRCYPRGISACHRIEQDGL